MGLLLSAQINPVVVEYLRSLQVDGQGTYAVDHFETEFSLNKLPGSDNAPICRMFIKDSTMHCQDLKFESEPLSMKSSKMCIEIGEAVVRCDDLGYIIKVSGRITIFDVLVNASLTPTFEDGINISDIGSEVTVKNIKSEIKLQVNGTDHSRLANVLLSIDNPDIASNLLNAFFVLQKDNIKSFINDNIRVIFSQFGL